MPARPCPGPLPPSSPKRVPPRGTCDTHVHVLGPYAKYPMIESRVYTAPEAPVERLKELLDALGVDRVIIVHVTVSGPNLSVTLDAMEHLGEQARGIAMIGPEMSHAELARLDRRGIRGARLSHIAGPRFDLEFIKNLAKRIEPLGWHLQFSPIDERHWLELAPFLGELGVDVVVDHMAWHGWTVANGVDQPGFQALLTVVRTGRVWVKLAGMERYSKVGPPTFSDVIPFAEALVEARPDRLLWGTDWPHVTAWDHAVPRDSDLLDWILDLGIADETKRQILVENPANLYRF